MFVVGLTGGVGSGKSTVSELLVQHGVHLIDADVVAREVVEPGTAGLSAIVDHFGSSVLDAESALDRDALAAIVFKTPSELMALNAIVHPIVRKTIADQLSALESTSTLVLLSVPLFVETGNYTADRLVVVDVPEEVAVARLQWQRGWSAEEVRNRMAAQSSRNNRLKAADYVIDNSGSPDDLPVEVEKAWTWIKAEMAAS